MVEERVHSFFNTYIGVSYIGAGGHVPLPRFSKNIQQCTTLSKEAYYFEKFGTLLDVILEPNIE